MAPGQVRRIYDASVTFDDSLTLPDAEYHEFSSHPLVRSGLRLKPSTYILAPLDLIRPRVFHHRLPICPSGPVGVFAYSILHGFPDYYRQSPSKVALFLEALFPRPLVLWSCGSEVLRGCWLDGVSSLFSLSQRCKLTIRFPSHTGGTGASYRVAELADSSARSSLPPRRLGFGVRHPHLLQQDSCVVSPVFAVALARIGGVEGVLSIRSHSPSFLPVT